MNLDNVKLLILDDEQGSLQQSRIAAESFLKAENIICSSSAVETMRIIESKPVDLVFLDIEMPDTNGFSVAEYIDSLDRKIKYVFLTGHSELAAKSYDYTPLDFLSKPIDIMRLRKTFERYEATQGTADYSKKRIAVNTNSGFVLISPADIIYIARENRRTVIHCNDGEYRVQYSLDETEILFKSFGLVRVHQSFIVPVSKIASVMPDDFGKTYWVRLSDGSKIPVSQKKYPKLKNELLAKGIKFV